MHIEIVKLPGTDSNTTSPVVQLVSDGFIQLLCHAVHVNQHADQHVACVGSC